MISNISDNDLVKKVQDENCSNCLSELISRHSGICFGIYNKYFHSGSTLDAQEVKEHKDFLIFQAAKTFSPDRGAKFSTWLGNTVKYACLNVCDQKMSPISVENETLHYFIDSRSEVNEEIYSDSRADIEFIKTLISQSKDKKIKKLMKLRYFGKKVLPFHEVAKKMGVSTQTVINWHDKFIDLLKNKLTTDTICDII